VPPATRWGVRGVIALYALIALVTFDYIEEDAFIYYRVAVNIANGDGYVFNAGGERIEVGSSLTWQYLLAGARLLSFDLILASKLLGIVFGGAALYLVWRISLLTIQNTRLQIVPALLLAVTIPFHGWVQRGLETPLYVLAIVMLAFFVLDESLQRYWFVPALLVTFSRSEGLIAVVGLSGFFYFERQRIRRHALGAGIFVAVVASSYVWRFFYFHDFMPHAYYSKILEPAGYGRGAALGFFFATHTWLVVAVAAIGLANRSAWNRPLVTLAVLELPFLWWGFTTHGYMPFNRHLVPALPLLYVIAGVGLDRLVLNRPVLRRVVGWGKGLFVLWLLVGAPAIDRGLERRTNPFTAKLILALWAPGQVAANLADLVAGRPRKIVRRGRYISDSITENWQFLVGEFIRETYPTGITIAYDQMGQTPWYAGLDKTFIDTWGLTYRATGFAVFNQQLGAERSWVHRAYLSASERLAGARGQEPSRRMNPKEAADHVLALRPHLIILNTMMTHETAPDGTSRAVSRNVPGLIAQDPRLTVDYVERKKWMFLRFFERKDLSPSIYWAPDDHRIPGKAEKPSPARDR
jgi:hypothetical protein